MRIYYTYYPLFKFTNKCLILGIVLRDAITYVKLENSLLVILIN